MASQVGEDGRVRRAIAPAAFVSGLAFLLVNNAVWVRRQVLEFPPPWDQALYLRLSLQCARALREGGLPALYHELVTGNRHVAPLFPLTAGLFHALLSESRMVAYMTNGLWLLVLLLSVRGLARALYGARAGALAVFVAATFPGIVNLSRDCQMDFPGASFVALGMWALARSDRLRDRSWTALAGAALGLTALAKAMSVAFFAPPLIWAAWSGARRRDTPPARQAVSLGLLLGTAALVAAPWYVPNLADVAWYLLYYGFLEGAVPYRAAGAGTFTIRNLGYYPLTIVNHGISFLYASLLLAVFVARTGGEGGPRGRPQGRGLLGAWIVGGGLILTLVPNKGGDHYVLSLLPGLAVLLAGRIAAIASARLRAAAVAAAIAIGSFNYAGLTYGAAYPPRVVRAGLLEIVSLQFPAYVAFRASLGPGPGRPWPVHETVAALGRDAGDLRARAASSPQVLARLEQARRAGDRAYLAAAYRLLLKREPDSLGIAAYLTDLRAGTQSHDHVLESMRLSAEYRERPLRVLVVPDHAVFNASTLLYQAVLERRPLVFEGPRAGLDSPEGPWGFDAAIVKQGGDQGLRHVLPDVERLAATLGRETALQPLGDGFACPDGSRLQIVAPSGLP